MAAGGNFIDTANIYAKGESEAIIGRWLAGRADRGKLVIATKVRNAVDGATAGPNDLGLSRSHILAAVEDSLRRLQTPYIDLYQVHVWDAGTPLEETLRALDDLVRSGKVRYTGWSNLTGWQVVKVVAESKRLGLAPPVSLQEQYSLLCRSTEWEVAEACASEGLALLPWSPLKGGWLSGKMTREAPPEGSRVAVQEAKGAAMQSHPTFSQFAGQEKVWALLEGLAKVAGEVGGGATVAQVAIRWLLQKPNVPAVVIGAKTVAQLQDNLGALRFALTGPQVAALDALSAEAPPYRECRGAGPSACATVCSPPYHTHARALSLSHTHTPHPSAHAHAQRTRWSPA